MNNINKLFNGRNDVIKFVDDYGSMILKAKRKAVKEEPKPEPTKAKTKCKVYSFQFHEKFINEIKNDGKNMNEQIFKEYFFYYTLSFLAKKLYNSNQYGNDQIVKHINDLLIELKKGISINKIPKNQKPNKIVEIVEKILNFNKQFPSELARKRRVVKAKTQNINS